MYVIVLLQKGKTRFLLILTNGNFHKINKKIFSMQFYEVHSDIYDPYNLNKYHKNKIAQSSNFIIIKTKQQQPIVVHVS